MFNRIFSSFLIGFTGFSFMWSQCDGCNPGIDVYFDFEDQGSIECIGNISISYKCVL